MSALDLSSDVALVAVVVLTLNILLGLLLSVRYNPWRHWPHRRINYFRLHNWTGYVALALSALHPLLILASSSAGFRLVDLIYPVNAPKQPWINTLGAASLYVLCLVVVTSYYRNQIGHGRWKILHFGAYVAAAFFYVHGIWSDPTLKDAQIDYLDAEKVLVEGCLLAVLIAASFRLVVATRRAREGRLGANATRRQAA